jgi:hypothetical protein
MGFSTESVGWERMVVQFLTFIPRCLQSGQKYPKSVSPPPGLIEPNLMCKESERKSSVVLEPSVTNGISAEVNFVREGSASNSLVPIFLVILKLGSFDLSLFQ